MNRISNDLREKSIIIPLSKGIGSTIFKYLIKDIDENIKWADIIENTDEIPLDLMINRWNEMGLDSFVNRFEAKATFKIYFMFFHEALPEDIRNNQYVRVSDIRKEFWDLKIPPVDFNNSEIARRTTEWLNEIPADV
jgi:hypothetical protein